MIVEYIRYTVDEARSADFAEVYRTAGTHLLASPHCLRFELGRCEEAPTSFIVRIEWTSTEDHLQRFRGSKEFRAFFGHVRAYVDDIEEMRHYAVLEEGDKAS